MNIHMSLLSMLCAAPLLAAASLGGRRSLGRALLNERRMAKPLTPLTRHWMSRLLQPSQERA